MNETPRVAVAIVGFRNTEDVSACLAALAASAYENFEVVVCENGGADAFSRLQAALPAALPGGQRVTVFDPGANLGFAGGVNAAIAKSPDAGAWWILNPDTQPEPEALGAMVRRLARGDCHGVGCVLIRPDGRAQSYGGRWEVAFARPVSLGLGAPGGASVDAAWVEARQNYLNGAAMLVDRRFVEVAGLMREDYFLYCEEVEWCLRAVGMGIGLGFAPEARVLHAQGTTTGWGGAAKARSRLSVYLGERNKLLLTRDLYPATMPLAAVAVLALIARRYALVGA